VQALRGILHTMAELEQERTAKQAEFQGPQAIGRQTEITQQIKALGDKLDTLRQELNVVATGVDLAVFSTPSQEKSLDVRQRGDPWASAERPGTVDSPAA
jgi:hypothetical protein